MQAESPVQLVAEVMTPHYGPYYQAKRADVAPGDYHDPNPIPFLAVEKGTAFLAGILPRSPSDADDAKQARAWLLEALQEIGAGAKTATGYGRCLQHALGSKPNRTAEEEEFIVRMQGKAEKLVDQGRDEGRLIQARRRSVALSS